MEIHTLPSTFVAKSKGLLNGCTAKQRKINVLALSKKKSAKSEPRPLSETDPEPASLRKQN